MASNFCKIQLKRTDSSNQDFLNLLPELDAYLAKMDGEEHAFYAQYNKVEHIKHVIVAYVNSEPVGCGAIKMFNNSTMEVKRMFTLHKARNKGIASQILVELEYWAKELNYPNIVLETGVKQTEAIALYTKHNYKRIGNYGQYTDAPNSRCFIKNLTNY